MNMGSIFYVIFLYLLAWRLCKYLNCYLGNRQRYVSYRVNICASIIDTHKCFLLNLKYYENCITFLRRWWIG